MKQATLTSAMIHSLGLFEETQVSERGLAHTSRLVLSVQNLSDIIELLHSGRLAHRQSSARPGAPSSVPQRLRPHGLVLPCLATGGVRRRSMVAE